jgi:hypothetical protein
MVHAPETTVSIAMARLQCAYIDLDGTLLGRGASLMHDGEGRPSLLAARAIEACLRADVEVVLVSGRRAAQMAEDSRLLGQRAYVFEAGAGLVVDGDTYWSTGDFEPEAERSIHDQIADTGAPALRSTTTPDGWSTTSPTTAAARSPTCSAASSTSKTPARSSPSTVTAA